MARMGIKEFLKPTKGKVFIFVLVIILIFASGFFSYRCFGPCNLTPTQQILSKTSDTLRLILSPGITNLLGDNGFFIGYKPYGNLGGVLEGIFHFGLDIIYWYLLSCIIIWIYRRIKNKNQIQEVPRPV